MSNDKEERSFDYTYSAQAQKEAAGIYRKYGVQPTKNLIETADLEELRQIDQSTAHPGRIISWIIGSIGTLVMGTGMCMCMVGGGELFTPGIGVGLPGMAAIIAAYPLYNSITKRQKKKNTKKILEISDRA